MSDDMLRDAIETSQKIISASNFDSQGIYNSI
jgi:hypothetical protein